jgi:hypothetical protein
MAHLPPLQWLGFGTSPGGSKETLHQACAQAEGGIVFFPHKSPLLALSGRGDVSLRMSALRVKRTSVSDGVRSTHDPQRTSARLIGCIMSAIPAD